MSLSNKERDVILFTGQSGVKISGCFNRLNNLTSLPPIFIEEKMQQISGKNFLAILSDPPRIQEELWKDAFNDVKKNLPSNCEPQKKIFIAFHASYFHQRKTEFLSPVDFGELLELKDRIKMIVVFIDDCYDIYRRLLDKKQMFAYIWNKDISPEDAIIQSIYNIFTILEWREIEIAFSRKIAQLLHIPMFVLAVKHPYYILSRLIEHYEKQNIFYLSHPISSIRQAEHPRITGFYSELNKVIQDMIVKENVILFIPDTIDERRIKTKNRMFIPEISEGWPLPFQDDWLFASLPSNVVGINPLNPRNFEFYSAGEGTRSTISKLIGILLNKINDQINSRDRTLVEQSKDGIIVYRQYWESRIPGGVEQELIYNSDLRENYNEDSRKVIIINTREDLAKLRIKTLFEIIKNYINIDGKQLDNICDDWIQNKNFIKTFLEIGSIIKEKQNLIESIEKAIGTEFEINDRKQGSTLSVGKMLAEHDKIKIFWEKTFGQILIDDPFLKYANLSQDIKIFCYNAELDENLKNLIKTI